MHSFMTRGGDEAREDCTHFWMYANGAWYERAVEVPRACVGICMLAM